MQQNAHVCDKSETCGENVNGETQEAAKALLLLQKIEEPRSHLLILPRWNVGQKYL